MEQIAELEKIPFSQTINISTKTGENIDKLKELLYNFVIEKNINNKEDLEYIKVQLVCLLPYQVFEKAHRKLERLITEVKRYQEYDR